MVIFMALVLAVTITYFTNDFYKTHNQLAQSQELFYSQKFEPEQKKIYLIGPSHVHRINATIIENYISQTHQDYKIYNLGIDGDNPSKRIDSLQKIIDSEPVLVVYGLTFKHFKSFNKSQSSTTDFIGINKPEVRLPEPWIFLYDWIPSMIKIDFSNFKNPQVTTIKIFEMITNQNDAKGTPNTPFKKHKPQTSVIKDEEALEKNLNRRITKGNIFSGYDSSVNELKTKDLKKIISELKKNDIDLILFSTPLSRTYLDEIDIVDIEIFESAFQKISDEFDVKIYHFYDKYADLKVWSDISHVSTNQNASIYSIDIADVILNEINP